jgi:sugar/nucleoside kinase (ribokinase family)
VLLGADCSYEVAAAETTLVDTLGAGDTFIGTLLVRLLEGSNPLEAMTTAAGASALTCSRLGAFGNGAPLTTMPSRQSTTPRR